MFKNVKLLINFMNFNNSQIQALHDWPMVLQITKNAAWFLWLEELRVCQFKGETTFATPYMKTILKDRVQPNAKDFAPALVKDPW